MRGVGPRGGTCVWSSAGKPSGTTIFREPDVLREARVLQGLAATAVPVPEVRWIEPDPSVLGAPFFVMERVAGRVPLGKPSIHTVGWLPELTDRERERLWASALEVLVALHAVEWETTHAFLLDGDAGERRTSKTHVRGSGRLVPVEHRRTGVPDHRRRRRLPRAQVAAGRCRRRRCCCGAIPGSGT